MMARDTAQTEVMTETTETTAAKADRMGFYERRFLDFAVAQKGDKVMNNLVLLNKIFLLAFAGFVIVAAYLWA